ncbi:MAG: signal transduction histidine kinase [Rhodoferax sp.]
MIELSNPGRCVLKVILKISSSASESHIFYLRDVTHETIVEDMKTEFLATTAHELRTPLAGVLGFTKVLLQQELDQLK